MSVRSVNMSCTAIIEHWTYFKRRCRTCVGMDIEDGNVGSVFAIKCVS